MRLVNDSYNILLVNSYPPHEADIASQDDFSLQLSIIEDIVDSNQGYLTVWAVI